VDDEVAARGGLVVTGVRLRDGSILQQWEPMRDEAPRSIDTSLVGPTIARVRVRLLWIDRLLILPSLSAATAAPSPTPATSSATTGRIRGAAATSTSTSAAAPKSGKQRGVSGRAPPCRDRRARGVGVR